MVIEVDRPPVYRSLISLGFGAIGSFGLLICVSAHSLMVTGAIGIREGIQPRMRPEEHFRRFYQVVYTA